MDGPPASHQFWAKLRYRDDDRSTGEIVGWHPLVAHSADVAAVTEALLDRTVLGRRLARLAGLDGDDGLDEVHVARLSALAALHDAGKVNHGFQDQAFDGAGRSPGHVKPMMQVLQPQGDWQERLLLPMGIGKMMSWFEGRKDPDHFLRATWGHHGEPVNVEGTLSASQWEPTDQRDPVGALEELGDCVENWFPNAFNGGPPFPAESPEFQHAYNGVLTLADWIGSSFPFLADDEERSVIERARDLAEEQLTEQGVLAESYQQSLSAPVGFDGILRETSWSPHPIQEATLNRPVYDEGGLTVLESDTGSGKTEAAIARFFRLYQKGEVDGMYFAVPTRTAAKQLYTRVDRITKRVYDRFEADPPPVVQAVPGYYKVDGLEGTPVAPFTVRWHDQTEEDEMRERRWAAEGPKRYLAGAIVVGTIDQALLSTLQVRHAHMRASALLRHFLVVDEVHASDVYMNQLLQAVLDHHLDAGGHALLMSATLGTEARMQLTDVTATTDDVPEPDDASEKAYPMVTHVNAERADPETKGTDGSGYRKEVSMTTDSIAGQPSTIARRAVEAARKGGRVLIIRNRVPDCIDVHEAIEQYQEADEDFLLQGNGHAVPHHSRYADEDRSRLDAAIEAAFGEEDEEGKEIPIEGVIAVATQTVQMSLDISASLMLTDLCPVDVLLQRIGRLHRHDRTHPAAFHPARCVVLIPETRDLSSAVVTSGEMKGRGLKGPHGLGTVYGDLRILEATWRLFENDEAVQWTIPDDNRRLVEQGTNPHRLRSIVDDVAGTELEEAEGAWELHRNWVVGERSADQLTAKNVLVQRHRLFGHQQFREDLKQVKTRLGRSDVRVDLPRPMPSPLAPDDSPTIEALSIPDHLIRERDEDPADFEDLEATHLRETEEGFAFTAKGKPFRYNRFGLAKERT